MLRILLAFSVMSAMISAFLSAAVADDKLSQPKYEDFFTDEALRVDLIHTGTRGEEVFGIDEIVAEPLWPGTRIYLVDNTGFGKYRFRVLDQATGTEIFSQGYCTLFGEWLTTSPAKKEWRSMTEPIRMPFPKAPVTLVMEVRNDKTGEFKEIQKLQIDTTAYNIRRGKAFPFDVLDLHKSERSPATALDIVIVPDGYTVEDEEKLEADAQRFSAALVNHSPFDKHKDKISVRLIKAFSRQSGPDEPRKGLFNDTIIGTSFDTFSSARYLTTDDMKRLREVASNAPYDAIFVMVNSYRYGGGGIFNSYSIFTSDSEYSEYVMVHEFGHGFGALADEYFSSPTGYEEDEFYAKGAEPWEPNITAQTKRDRVKWKHHIKPDTPIPTPDEIEYDNVVGLFQGGGYKAKGLYRPTRDSKMHHKGLLPFGPVNEEAIENMIHYFTDCEVMR